MPRDRLVTIGLSLVLVLSCFCAGCDDDDEMTGTPCLEFTPVTIPDPLTVTATEGQGSTCDIAVIDLIVTDVSDLFAASFDVNFDSTRVSLVTVSTANSILTSDGAPILRVVEQLDPGHWTVGLSRLQVTTGVDVVGGAKLAALTFVRAGTGGTSTLTFTEAELDTPGEPPVAIPGVTFHGGSFQIFSN